MTLAELQQAFEEAKAKYHTDKTNKKAKKAFKKAKKALAAANEANNGTETNSKKRSLDVSEETPKKKAKTGPSLADLKKANKEAKAAWKASDGDKKLKKIWKKAKAALAEAKAQQGEEPEVQEKEEKVEVKVDVDALKAAVKAARKIFKQDKSNKEAKKALKAAKKVLAEAEANAGNNEKETVKEETAADEGSMDLLASLKKNKPADETESVLSGLKKGGGGGFAAKGGAKGAKGNNPPSRRLFVGNLSFNIDDDKCKEYFKDCGEIIDLHWLEHRDTGKFKGCGFISFATQEEADKAMAKNGLEFMGRPMTIDYDKERAPRKKHDQGEKAPSTRLFLGNISDDADDALITEFFKECGPLIDIHWVTDRDSGEFRGFGFCTFSTQEEATKAYGMTGSNFLGKRIRIDYTLPRPSRGGGGKSSRPLSEKLPGCTSIFIGNLSDAIDDDKIRELFKDAGEISQIRWLKDRETGEFKCAGFVEFEDPEASLDLAVKHNGEEILGKNIRIDYAKPRQPRP